VWQVLAISFLLQMMELHVFEQKGLSTSRSVVELRAWWLMGEMKRESPRGHLAKLASSIKTKVKDSEISTPNIT
jgi:hypothetical protein